MTDAVLEAAPAALPKAVTPAYRHFALGLLVAIYTVNFLDRQVINILAEPIKNDLKLADWQVGLLSGFAFGLEGAIDRWVDSLNAQLKANGRRLDSIMLVGDDAVIVKRKAD